MPRNAAIHPANGILNPLVLTLPALIFGTPVAWIAAVSAVGMVQGLLVHSQLPWRLGWAGRWIVNSPASHRLHHSKLPQYRDRNFGAQLILWDRLFGTWAEGTARPALVMA